MRHAVAILLAILTASGTALAQDREAILGEATVVDSDGLRVGGKSVMLWGIESVERPQTCTIDNVVWACYPAAVRALETLAVGEIRCETVGEPDGYGRVLGTCWAGEINLNQALVRAGFALAKRDETEDYVAAEEAAKAEGIGFWQGEFVHPRDFRRSHAIRVDRP